MPTYANWQANPYQYSLEDYTTSTPEGDQQAISYSPGYLQELLALRHRVMSGQATPWDREWYAMQAQAAQAVPMRDVSTLTFNAADDAPDRLSGGSPDLAKIMLTLVSKLEQGTATPQERDLFQTTYTMLADQNYRASVPQASDANPFGLGDNLFSALAMLGLGSGAAAAIAPLAAGAGVTLAGASALAGTAGGLAGMLAEPLDSQALRLAGLSLGAAGGVTSLASLLSNGLNSVGDVVSAVQKVYGTSTKARQLVQAAQQAGSNPAAVQAASQATQGRTVGSTNQALTAADSRTQGRTTQSSTAASSTPGGTTMAEQQNPLGSILAGLVGGVGSVLSLADVSRYMSQLKDKFKDEQGQQDLIDQAYELALARYETMYARTEQEYTQKQEAYTKALERYDTRYTQQQKTYDQQQEQFAKIEGQTAQDRDTQYQNYWQNRAKVDEAYNRQVQEAKAERDYQVSRDSANVAKYDAAFNEQAAQAKQDRDTEYRVFEQQYAKYQQNFDTREAQAVEERGLDLNAYQQRQAIGRNLSDPAALKAGAEALYQPLSDLARDRVNTQTEEEMARRGVAGGGMYSNLLAAKAFAPQEQQLWSNALNAYLSGQTGALNAYTQQDMTMSPEYRQYQMPQFSKSPGYQAISAPNLADSPGYTPYNTPSFTQSNRQSVPQAPGYDQYPGVPTYQTPGGVPTARSSTATPYAPFGSDAKTGQTTVNNLAGLVTQLARSGVPQQLLKYISGLLGRGGGNQYDYSYDYGGNNNANQPYDDWSWDGSPAPTYTPDYSYDYNTDFTNMPYDDWSY